MGTRNGRFERCDFTMIDCASKGGRLQDQLGNEFIDCKFTGALLRKCTLNGKFVRCEFTGADLYWGHFETTTFEECTFTECRFGGDARHWDEMREPL